MGGCRCECCVRARASARVCCVCVGVVARVCVFVCVGGGEVVREGGRGLGSEEGGGECVSVCVTIL